MPLSTVSGGLTAILVSYNVPNLLGEYKTTYYGIIQSNIYDVKFEVHEQTTNMPSPQPIFNISPNIYEV